MKRCLSYVLPFVLLGVACKTAAPRKGPETAPGADPLRAYVGQVRVLRHEADKTRVRIDPKRGLNGGCAVAVRVRASSFQKDEARFALETVGVPKLAGKRLRCRRVVPELDLTLAGLHRDAPPAEVAARIEGVLQTAESYLKSMGLAFDLAPGKPPAEAACREAFATSHETALAQQVKAWPQPLLSVDVWYRDRSGRVRQESEVEMQAIVGSDGRLHRPRLKTSLGDAHRDAVLLSLGLWRFTPARSSEGPVPARVALQPVLHIY